MCFRLAVLRKRYSPRAGLGWRQSSCRSRIGGISTRCRKSLSKTFGSSLLTICGRFFARRSVTKLFLRQARDRDRSGCRSPQLPGLLEFDTVRLQVQPRASVLYLSHDPFAELIFQGVLNGFQKSQLSFCSTRRNRVSSCFHSKCIFPGSWKSYHKSHN